MMKNISCIWHNFLPHALHHKVVDIAEWMENAALVHQIDLVVGNNIFANT